METQEEEVADFQSFQFDFHFFRWLPIIHYERQEVMITEYIKEKIGLFLSLVLDWGQTGHHSDPPSHSALKSRIKQLNMQFLT